MTRLLVSVKNPAEALLALAAGVDIIDLKDPNVGALGALDTHVTTEIVRALKQANQYLSGQNTNYYAMLSTTVGENHQTLAGLLEAIEEKAKLGFNYIKIAMSDFVYAADFKEKIYYYSQRNIKVVVVFFADSSVDLKLIPQLKNMGIYGVMLDTQSKDSDLLTFKSQASLEEFVAICKNNDLISGLAGSLKPQHIDLLCKINATYIGFRGGVCNNNLRNTDLSREKVGLAVSMLRENHKNIVKMNKNLGLALHS